MSELKNCPFCESGGGSIQPDFDSERAAKGLNGHYIECRSCFAASGYYPTIEESSTAWNRRPEPRQLTLDELRQMDGQPVWVNVLMDDYPGEWALASEFCNGATTATSVYQYDNYGVNWIAYDRPLGGDRL